MIDITEKEFEELSAYIKNNFGIYLKKEKKFSLMNKLQNELVESGCNSFQEYYNQIIADKSGRKVDLFVNRITTNHTFFMRESDHFFYFRDTILPYLKKTVVSNDLRIWSAACSSGEEPYTLAIILQDFFKEEKGLWDKKILATDICNEVLDKAKAGVYSKEEFDSLPYYWKMNYFRMKDKDKFEVREEIKSQVIYRRFNLMEASYPFKKKFHVIFCRNVMIYFDNETKERLVNRFYDYTEKGGYLFVGHSESLNGISTKYKYVLPAIYRKEE